MSFHKRITKENSKGLNKPREQGVRNKPREQGVRKAELANHGIEYKLFQK